MKTLYLIFKRYSRYFIRELALAVQIVIIGFALTYAFTYMFEASAKERYVAHNFDCGASYFAFNETFQDDSMGEPRDLANDEMWHGALKTLQDLPGKTGLGTARDTDITVIDSQGHKEEDICVAISMYSTDLIRHVNMPLSAGRWFTDAEAAGIDSYDTIPVVLGMLWNGKYKVGDEIRVKTKESHMGVKEATLKVIGIFAGDAMPFQLVYGGTYQQLSSVLMPEFDKVSPFVISPPILKNGKWIDNDYFLVGCNVLIFHDKSTEHDAEWSKTLAEYGTVTSMDALVENDKKEFVVGGGTYFMHGIMALLLVTVGVLCYNVLSLRKQRKMFGVYTMCGMTVKKALQIVLLGNGILFAAASVLGAIAGNAAVMATRTFMSDSQWLGALFSILVTFGLYVVTSAGVVFSLIKRPPAQLIINGGLEHD